MIPSTAPPGTPAWCAWTTANTRPTQSVNRRLWHARTPPCVLTWFVGTSPSTMACIRLATIMGVSCRGSPLPLARVVEIGRRDIAPAQMTRATPQPRSVVGVVAVAAARRVMMGRGWWLGIMIVARGYLHQLLRIATNVSPPFSQHLSIPRYFLFGYKMTYDLWFMSKITCSVEKKDIKNQQKKKEEEEKNCTTKNKYWGLTGMKSRLDDYEWWWWASRLFSVSRLILSLDFLFHDMMWYDDGWNEWGKDW